MNRDDSTMTDRRACAIPDLPHGWAFFHQMLRVLRLKGLEIRVSLGAMALPRSGMAQARLCRRAAS